MNRIAENIKQRMPLREPFQRALGVLVEIGETL